MVLSELSEHRARGGDEEVGALVVRQEHGDVLAGARRLQDLVRQRQGVEPGRPWRLAAGIGVDDELRAAAQRCVAGGVHVADDHVGLEARGQQRVGAAVDGDDPRPHVADVRPQHPQVLLVVDPSHDDQRRVIAKVGVEARQLDPPGEQLALLEHVLDRVAREGLERVADLTAPLIGGGAHGGRLLHRAGRDDLGTAQDLAAADRDRVAVLESSEERVVGQIDQMDARLDEQQRPHVRIGPGRGCAAVEHREHTRGDEVLGGHAIEIAMVEDCDLARSKRLDDELRAPAEPSGSGQLAGNGNGHRLSLDGPVNGTRRSPRSGC
ncbi:MAG: hypothetical protein KY463_09455 [Actinobacteria bacterium]|nr:hypothetical protein [Actinomycetota bacterium]